MRLTMLRVGVCAGVSMAVLAGCAGSQKAAVRQRGPVCDEATGRAVAAHPAAARAYAKASLTYQIQDLRGYLAQDGLRAIVVDAPRVACKPYLLGFGGSGLKHCVATARVCGQ
jgi:hypothetical protein